MTDKKTPTIPDPMRTAREMDEAIRGPMKAAEEIAKHLSVQEGIAQALKAATTPKMPAMSYRFPDAAVLRTTRGPSTEERVGSSRVDLQACKLEYSIVSPK